MSMENLNQSEKKDFLVSSASLKDVRAFSRDVFEKFKIDEDLREELVLAIAEAAQNIVKHAYKDFPNTQDRMVVRISCKDEVLEISFFDKGKPVEESKVKHRAIDDIKPGGLGTFFIQEIMDSIKFEPGKKPWINNLVLTKKLVN
ncbi:ATP-binding protein [Candidatus Pelagibacter ubique]|jgi:serine/threonine-protein kinase RsbW|nr:ATP-binding protein [Candidatus Pelagibacter ubique]MDB9751229.1 ATP-binding protein [Candidatus Pelagibacter ubique]